MRKLVYFVAISIDGFIAGPSGESQFFPFEGDHIAGQLDAFPETLPLHIRKAILGEDSNAHPKPKRFDTVLMGRKTYEIGFRAGFLLPYEPLAHLVFSKTMQAKDESGLRITAEDPVQIVRELKSQSGRDLWLCGGGELAGILKSEIDELIVKVNPVLAGNGIRLMDGHFDPRALVLRERRNFESGVIWLSYDLA